ncbi:hypothetical protein [Microbacterium sp. APC 3901]|uniref:hypothetical protein n=1 Tax=Microbacterium sp. APC 3901 TaxID=3035192 RepID=UPI0025B5A76A|nr:hypothetical protein [Microbacterium sp. APC 3901]MDN3445325.1 hypothetical protein [Microbacterium sp. APC 3901]
MRRRRMLAAAAAVGGLLTALMLGTPAFADAGADTRDRVDPLILEVMAEVPGGVIIDAQHAVWFRLGMELVAAEQPRAESTASVGSCATGTVCVYTGSSLGGAKLSWSACGVLPIPSSFSAKSIADARSGGYAQARNGTTVLATALAGGWANVGGTSTNVRCVL